jgi:hypothetical protein
MLSCLITAAACFNFTRKLVCKQQPRLHSRNGTGIVAAADMLLLYCAVLMLSLQLDRDEVRLRRTIGLKKDEFTIDRKHVKCVAGSSSQHSSIAE